MTSTSIRNQVTSSFKSSSNVRDLTKLFEDNTLRTIFYNMLDNLEVNEPETVALTGGVMVAMKFDRRGVTSYGTQAAPATSGDLAVSSAVTPTAEGKARVLYQAASVPTITGIEDVNITSAWDNANINIVEVTYYPDGTYVGRHLGTL